MLVNVAYLTLNTLDWARVVMILLKLFPDSQKPAQAPPRPVDKPVVHSMEAVLSLATNCIYTALYKYMDPPYALYILQLQIASDQF